LDTFFGQNLIIKVKSGMMDGMFFYE